MWGPVILLWILRFFLEDNETVNWLFVMTSNFTMLGPILLYWLATIMIMVGWVTDNDIMFTGRWVGKFFLWVLLTFVASFYQISWIDSIRDLYSGDSWVFEEVESIQDSVEDTTVNERLL